MDLFWIKNSFIFVFYYICIACSSCNNEKGNKSPFEVWGDNAEKYNEIMSRVEFLPTKMQWRFEKNAMEKFNNESDYIKLPTNGEYVEGSFQLTSDDVEEMELMA